MNDIIPQFRGQKFRGIFVSYDTNLDINLSVLMQVM
jgi:hypothetical protein